MDPQRGLSRRTIVKGVAWAVPVITLTVAAPAAAASGVFGLTATRGNIGGFEACDTIPAGTIVFLATINGAHVGAGERVVVTLPSGFTFVGGSTQKTLLTDASGLVSVPAVIVGTVAGAYAIGASYAGLPAQTFFAVTAGSGQMWAFANTGSASQIGALSTALTGSSPDANIGGNYVVRPDSSIGYWGSATNGTAPGPKTLATSSGPLTAVTKLRAWGSLAGSSGGMALSGSTLYQWGPTGGGATPLAKAVTGLSGTIIDFDAHLGSSYVLTTAGLYYWGSYFGETSVKGPVAGTAGATELSTWGSEVPGIGSGGAVIIGGKVYSWGNTKPPRLALIPGAPSGVLKVGSTQSGTIMLTDRGDFWTAGAAYSSSPGGTGARLRISNVADFDTWGAQGAGVAYMGGAAILANGSVVEFDASGQSGSANVFRTQTVAGLHNVTITKVSASDGVYSGLASNGRVYRWTGNLDGGNGAVTAAAQVPNLPSVIDWSAWGLHDTRSGNGNFTGGGIAVVGSQTC
jgi:hypothetical protein